MDRATRKQLDEVIRWQTQILRDFDPAVRAAQLAAIQPVEITQAFKNYQQFTNTIRDSGLFSAMEAARVASQTMANMLVDFDDIVSSAITAFVESGSLFYEQGRLIRQLPSFLDLERLRKSLERNARDTLDKEGFGYAQHLWDLSFLAGFAGIDSKTRSATVVNKLAAFTRTKEFEQQLGQAFRDSKLLLRRWEIVELALRAHCQRTYLLSVPPLLAQVEGAVGDAVVLKGVARPIGGKLYQLDPSGNISKDRKGNDVEFKSVAALLKNAGFKHPIVLDVSTVISDRIIGERNAVLHGRKTDYGKAGISVHSLMVLYVLGKEIAAFEQGNVAL